ncbi:MAG: transposase [Planctomycetes bacterium]|nr:transposase [Planctomycetota bacterium]MBL7038626.1 transposase [Pirellulaceae bacterium]
MRFFNPKTGKTYVRKLRRRFDIPGQARELTFSCYRRFQFLSRDRTREWFIEAMENARQEWPIDYWAYVIMPEHVHLLVYPREPGLKLGPVPGTNQGTGGSQGDQVPGNPCARMAASHYGPRRQTHSTAVLAARWRL